MNMILVSLGYSASMVLPDDVDAGVVIAALSRGQMVSSHGYGKDEKFTVEESAFSVRRIPASMVIVDEEGKASIKAAELQTSLDYTNKRLAEALEKIKALEATA